MRKLHLNAFLMGVGHHEAAWRTSGTDPSRVTDIRHYQELAQIAERGKLDSVFLADSLSFWGDIKYHTLGGLEPVTMLSAMAAVTEHVGLIGTVSTTYNEPFNVARKFASLDHISRGRAGWNMVTSAFESEARNFGGGLPAHADRYVRANEFVDVVTKLWDSWADDAIVADQDQGVYVDKDKVHAVDHEGDLFRVHGPLNIPRPPQGRPVLVQAGSSEDGKEFAARYAEAVFTAQPVIYSALAFYADFKGRLAKYGRDHDDVVILPGLSPIIGSTEAEATRLREELGALVVPESAVGALSEVLGVDLTDHPLDEQLPEIPGVNEGQRSRAGVVMAMARRENLTMRQLIGRLAGNRGHRVVAGTPEQIADEIEEWFTKGAADGFNVMPPTLPGGLTDFVDHVVPELRRRGLFRTEYEGSTLREHFGFKRPAVAHA
ncbi:LLM class flavin-dependent oxidoreductase [Nonomuraea sp. MCN248]|uniref:LLM class flavin-dependent oxidoreductase n=1 Tax=Nonomuraea corallina TaxID=2989783 RepID=A0ABT4S6H8_9ACTN|nr:LLM class flavin-dependent oxidoreductase [Nonomuraea corallina]MDA0632658.1 LLM class flavin-dependent oxidoreductase [Nonomuraea corallina]